MAQRRISLKRVREALRLHHECKLSLRKTIVSNIFRTFLNLTLDAMLFLAPFPSTPAVSYSAIGVNNRKADPSVFGMLTPLI